MEISNEPLTWSSEDIAVFRTFLNTATGQKFLSKLLENVPPLLPSGDTNSLLIRMGEVRAWQDAAKSILALTAPPPMPPDQATHSRQYPDPTDDDSWQDGQKTR